MLCSVLIPTRHRVTGLANAIRSLHLTANPANFDVRVRVDDDDHETLGALPSLATLYGNVHVHVGSRGKGYASLGAFINELAAKSDAKWVTMVDDDVTLEGQGWDEQLAKLPLTNTVAVPEFYHLGPNLYPSGSCEGQVYLTGWFAPNGSWRPETISNPVDAWILNTLVKQRGWRIATLRGITYNHQQVTREI